MNQFIFYCTLSLMLFASNDAEQLYLKNACNSCHGMYGEGIGTTPKLQGQKASDLKKRLLELKKGITKTPQGAIMISFAKQLSDEDIDMLAYYLSTLTRDDQRERYEIEYDSSGDGGS